MNVGIDMEPYENLPGAGDAGAAQFYADHFTAAETAYCQLQRNPRKSFCGLWCAKEAVMKCGPAFMKLRPLEMEIGHDERGRPFLSVIQNGKQNIRGECVISISYARELCLAVCVVKAT